MGSAIRSGGNLEEVKAEHYQPRPEFKPAARNLKPGFVNWHCLRTSYASWLTLNGADVKDAQALYQWSYRERQAFIACIK